MNAAQPKQNFDDNMGTSNPSSSSSKNKIDQLLQLAVIVAHEDRNTVQQIKDVFESADVSLQVHRVTSLDDLEGSLQVQDWDIICSLSHSNEFDPQKVCEIAEKHGNGAATIYIHDDKDDVAFDTLLNYGYKDHVSDQEPTKILHSFVREAIAARNAKLVHSNLDLIEEYNRKNTLLLDASADAIVYIADGMIMHGNQAFVDMLCFDSLDDLVWQSFIDYISANEQSTFKAALKSFRKKPDVKNSVDIELVSEDSSIIEANIAFAAATHEGEHCTQLVIRKQKAELEANADPVNTTNNLNSTQHADESDANLSDLAAQQPSIASNTHAVLTDEALQKFSQYVEGKSGKGHILHAHLNFENLYKSTNTLAEYSQALADFAEDLFGHMQNSFVSQIQISTGDWLLATNEDNASDAKTVADQLQSQLSEKLSTTNRPVEDSSLLTVGAAPYGVADITAYEAVAKAYDICANTVLTGGDFAEYKPRISDSNSSAVLISALELERLKIKFQPVIALLGQTQHLYEASIFLVEDDNLERSAHDEMLSLGVEVENTRIDKWFFNGVLETLLEAASNDEHLCINVPISASGIIHKDFFPDIMMAFEKSGLSKSCISFSANVEVAKDYPEKAIKLFSLLRQAGFNTSLENVSQEHLQLLSSIKPCYASIDPIVTSDKSDDSWRANLKTIFDAAKSVDAQSIVCGVTSAAELAQIWQSGAPLVKGNYLQEPMPSLDYEFSELN